MLPKNEFNKIVKELKMFEEGRERVIQLSRTIIQLSKRIIYALQRDEPNTATKLLKQIKQGMAKLPNKTFDAGIQHVAVQEYVEALCFYEFVTKRKIPTKAQLKVDTHNYLLGLCDLTGELVRKAVRAAIKKKPKQVEQITVLVDEIYGEFLKLDLRNGELRKKSDSIKWNLQKLEDLMQNIK